MGVRKVYLIILIATFALISCQQDPEAPALPYVTVEVPQDWSDFTYKGGSREVVLKANRSWSVECDAEWLAFDPQSAEVESGHDEEFTVIITAFPNDIGNDLDTRVRFKTAAVYADVTVRQEQNPSKAPELIYYNNFGTDYEGWTGSSDHPKIHESNCWRYERGAGISTLEYCYTDEMTARHGSTYDSMDYNGASAGNHLYFNKTGTLVLAKLGIHPDLEAIDISFGALRSVHNDYENIVDLDGEWTMHVSKDGTNWVKLPLSTSSQLKNGCWAYCTAGFAFGQDVPEYLYIRFKPSVVYRFDDLKISKGKSVQVIDWSRSESIDISTYKKLN